MATAFSSFPLLAASSGSKSCGILSKPMLRAVIGIVLLLLCASLGLTATGEQIMTIESCSQVMFIAGVLHHAVGKRIAASVLLSVACLLLTAPVHPQIQALPTGHLQTFIIDSATHILNSAHMPVLKGGVFIPIQTCPTQAALACSSIRFLVPIVVLSVLIGYRLFSSTIERMLLLIVSIPVALLGNMFRVPIAGFLASKISPHMSYGFTFSAAGILTFSLSLLALLGSVFLIRWIERKRMQYISWFLR